MSFSNPMIAAADEEEGGGAQTDAVDGGALDAARPFSSSIVYQSHMAPEAREARLFAVRNSRRQSQRRRSTLKSAAASGPDGAGMPTRQSHSERVSELVRSIEALGESCALRLAVPVQGVLPPILLPALQARRATCALLSRRAPPSSTWQPVACGPPKPGRPCRRCRICSRSSASLPRLQRQQRPRTRRLRSSPRPLYPTPVPSSRSAARSLQRDTPSPGRRCLESRPPSLAPWPCTRRALRPWSRCGVLWRAVGGS